MAPAGTAPRPIRRVLRRCLTWGLPGVLLALTASLSGVGLLAVSGWFLAACAHAGGTTATALAFNFFYPSVAVRLLAAARTLSRYGERVVTHDVTLRVLSDLRRWFYGRIEPLVPARLRTTRSGDMLNRIVADIDALDNLYPRVVSPALAAIVLVAAVTMLFARFHPLLAGVALVSLSVGGLALPAAAAAAGTRAGRAMARRIAGLRLHTVDLLQGMPELLVYGARDRQLERIAAEDERLMDAQLRMSRLRGRSAALYGLVSGAGLVALLLATVAQVDRGTLSGPLMVLLIMALVGAADLLSGLLTASPHLGRVREAARRLSETAAARPPVQFPARGPTLPPAPALRFQGVGFGYPDGEGTVLEDLSFRLPSGAGLAILGPTGAGKTTVAALLARFWDPDRGRIRLGGVDLASLDEDTLRRSVAVVPQQVHVFTGTLRHNLALAGPQASDRRMRRALRTACLQRFLDSLPRGLDTWVGVAGRRLSGGEARRLAVARAVLQDAPVWVLDEPTEGLDRDTALELVGALRRLTAARSTLLITHRPGDLDLVDEVLVLENGRTVERGAAAELASGNSRFSHLFQTADQPPAGR